MPCFAPVNVMVAMPLTTVALTRPELLLEVAKVNTKSSTSAKTLAKSMSKLAAPSASTRSAMGLATCGASLIDTTVKVTVATLEFKTPSLAI